MAESMIESTRAGKGGLGGGIERGSFTPKRRTWAARLERQRQVAARQQKNRDKAKAAKKARKRQRKT